MRLRIHQADLNAASLQNLKQPHPVHASRFHCHSLDSAALESIGERVEVLRKCRKAPDRIFIAVGGYRHEYLGCPNINTSGVWVNHQWFWRRFRSVLAFSVSSYDMGSIRRSTDSGRSRLMMLSRACRQESWFILFAEVDRLGLLMGVSATTLLRSSFNGVQAILVLFAVTLFSALPARSEDLALRIDRYLKTRVANNQFRVKVLVARGDHVLIRREYHQSGRNHGSVKNDVVYRFPVGTIAEQFVAAAVLQLEEQGKIRMTLQYVVTYRAVQAIGEPLKLCIS